MRMAFGSEIIAAMDSDDTGEMLAALIENAVRESDRTDLIYRRHRPAKDGQDWKDVLKSGSAALLPTIEP